MPVLLVICFTLSGASSLVLQVVWVRKLVGVFGSSSLAISTVLATFMAGMALGSWLGGRLADRLAERRGVLGDPLFYYGLAELAVAVAALALLPLADGYRGANAWLWQRLGDEPALLSLCRFGLTATALLIPTTAMGATLPLLSRRITSTGGDLEALGRRLGALYAVNTAGAVLGAGGAGFYLVPSLGVAATNRVAAALAATVGVMVIAAALRARRRGPDRADDGALSLDAAPPTAPPLALGRRDRRLVLAVYALSGAVAMTLEVLWSRALAVVIGSSVYSFTLVLCTFLVGISLGSAAAAPAASRTRDPKSLLGALFALIALGVVFTHQLTDELPGLFLALLEGTTMEVTTVLGVHTFLTGLVILPAALGLGAVMPLAVRAYVGGLDEVGGDVGRAYASNTVGAIAGAFLGGFVILPLVGLERGVRAAAVVSALLAVACVIDAGRRRRVAVGTFAALAALAAVLGPGWNRSDFTAGLFRTHQARDYIEGGGLFARDIVYYRDGISTTVSVERAGDSWILRNNGKVEASDHHDMPTQILVGLLPVLLHGERDLDVFMVGYGSGVTVGSMAVAPRVAHVDVVELEPAVYEAADRYFGDANNQVASSPKVTRLLGDGRNVLLAGDRRYDLIVSEPSNPWIAGVASLFTREFYALAKQHLAEGGVFCQWAQLYELGPRNVKMIYRTFSASFDHVYAFTPGDETTDTILLGSDRPLDLDLDRLRAAIAASPALAAELARAEVTGPEDLAASLLLAPDEIAAFTAGAEINTDDNASLEFSAPIDLLASASEGYFARLVRGDGWPYGYLEGIVTGADRPEVALKLASTLLGYGRLSRARDWIERSRALGADPADLAAVETVAALAAPRDFLDPELSVTAGGPVLPKPSPELFAGADGSRELLRLYALVAEGRWQAAWQAAREVPPRSDTAGGRDVSLIVAYAAYKALEMRAALDLLEDLDAAGEGDRRPAVLYYLGRVHYGIGHFQRGVDALERFAAGHPELAREAVASRLGP